MSYPRLDSDAEFRKRVLPLCRLSAGETWRDPEGRHTVSVIDACSAESVGKLAPPDSIDVMINDPPYNVAASSLRGPAVRGPALRGPTVRGPTVRDPASNDYVAFSQAWIDSALPALKKDSHFYLWLGADQNNGFYPLPEVILLLRDNPDLTSRSLITVRNQRGYGTQKNWMAVRQELLYYVKGNPEFTPTYTDIPKILRGYYKEVSGKRMENLERGRGPNLRPGNVWVDIQQVFYRMHEHVPGAYAQKPLSAVERILKTSSSPGDTVADFFCHSGATLVACERLGRRCVTSDIDPIFAELTIRRIERLRQTGQPGWQRRNPFPEIEV